MLKTHAWYIGDELEVRRSISVQQIEWERRRDEKWQAIVVDISERWGSTHVLLSWLDEIERRSEEVVSTERICIRKFNNGIE